MVGLGLSFTDLVDKLVSREKLWIILQFFEHVCNLLWIFLYVLYKPIMFNTDQQCVARCLRAAGSRAYGAETLTPGMHVARTFSKGSMAGFRWKLQFDLTSRNLWVSHMCCAWYGSHVHCYS